MTDNALKIIGWKNEYWLIYSGLMFAYSFLMLVFICSAYKKIKEHPK